MIASYIFMVLLDSTLLYHARTEIHICMYICIWKWFKTLIYCNVIWDHAMMKVTYLMRPLGYFKLHRQLILFGYSGNPYTCHASIFSIHHMFYHVWMVHSLLVLASNNKFHQQIDLVTIHLFNRTLKGYVLWIQDVHCHT